MALNEDYVDWTKLLTSFGYAVKVSIKQDSNTVQETTFSEEFETDRMVKHHYELTDTSVQEVDPGNNEQYTHIFIHSDQELRVVTDIMNFTFTGFCAIEWLIGSDTLDLNLVSIPGATPGVVDIVLAKKV